MSWEELVAYCIEHMDSIYVRLGDGNNYINVPLAIVEFKDVVMYMKGWHEEGRVPYRVIPNEEDKKE